jgi:hypothetical protein
VPTPKVSKIIKLTVSSGIAGQAVTFTNRTTGDKISTVLGASGKIPFAVSNFPNDWTEGDIIDIKVSGEVLGSSSVTLSGDVPQSVSITSTAITSGLSRGI